MDCDFLLQVPCHNKLSSGKSDAIIKKLVDKHNKSLSLVFLNHFNIDHL